MKKITIILFLMALVIFGQSQNANPVAVNDTAYGTAGEYITVHVLHNDYDPDGDAIKVDTVSTYGDLVSSFTDSTITLYIDELEYGGCNKIFQQGYRIIDEYGNSGMFESTAYIILIISPSVPMEFLDINNIKARFNPFGNLFERNCYEDGYEIEPAYEYPNGSEKNLMWTANLWIGGYDQSNNLHFSGERYINNGRDFWTGPLSDDGSASIDSLTSKAWKKIWKINIDEINYHIAHWTEAGYQPIEVIADWPAHGDPGSNQSEYLAPFVDYDNDGQYNPLNGDYPWIRGDQSIYFIYNDQKIHGESEGLPLGIEIHGMAYAFGLDNSNAFINTIFISYKIINRSSTTYTDAYVGTFNDFDIGYAWDDFVGCDVQRGAFYGYNGDDFDGEVGWHPPSSYGSNIPAQGIVVLGGPLIDADGIDNPLGQCDESTNGVGFGDLIADNERYGMNRFVYFNSSGGPQGRPENANEYYNYLKGIWKDETVMEYGGNGHVSSGAYGPACRFMFPGTSDPCNWGTNGVPPYGPVDWTEESTGNSPLDRSGLSSMGPFTLEAGGYYNIDIAYVTAEDGDPQSSVALLMTYIDEVRTAYFENPDNFGSMPLSVSEAFDEEKKPLHIWPNPAKGFLSFDNADGTYRDYTICNLYGQTISKGVLQEGRNNLNISDLNHGIYILQMVGEKAVNSAKFIKQ